MNLKTMPMGAQLACAFVATAAVVASQFFWAPGEFNKKAATINELQQTLEAKNAQVRKGELAVKRLDELQRDIASLERKLADLRQILPPTPDMGDLLKWVKSLSDQTNLELISFHPAPLTDREFLKEVPIRLHVIGNYHQFGLFFDRVSKYQRIINIEQLSMGHYNGKTFRATVEADFLAKTYVYKEDEKAEKKPAGGGA